MIKRCLMKMSLLWMVRHKERYLLSWVSFAVISLFFIFVYSVAGNIFSQVTDYVQHDMTSNQVHIQNMRVTEDGVEKDLDIEKGMSLAQEVSPKGVRAIWGATRMVLDKENAKEMLVATFYKPMGLLLESDYMEQTKVAGDLTTLSEKDVVVLGKYVDTTGKTPEELLGTEITVKEGETLRIGAVITGLPSGSFLNTYDAFFASEDMDQIVDYITYDFENGKQMTEGLAVLRDKGYACGTNSVNAEKMNEVAEQYTWMGTLIGGLLAAICILCLVNSLLVTLGENAAFMELFRLMGLTKGNYVFMTCFTAGIQGIIGGGLGVGCAFLLCGPIFQWLKVRGLSGMEILSHVQVSTMACVASVGICLVVSVITGMIALRLLPKADAETVADNELL